MSDPSNMSAVRRETIAVDPLAHSPQRAPTPDVATPDRPSELHRAKSMTTELLVEKFLAKTSIQPIDISKIPKNIAGLQQLAKHSAWKYVTDLSNLLLRDESIRADYTANNQLQKYRLEALFRLKLFDELSQESQKALGIEESALLSLSKQSCFSLPGHSTYNSDKCIGLRLLQAEIKLMTGRGEEALEQLYYIYNWLTSEVNMTPTTHWWSWRVQNAIVNCLIRLHQWRQSITELKNMLQRVQLLRKENFCVNVIRAEVVLTCRLARLLIQMGILQDATVYVAHVTALLQEYSSLQHSVLEDHVTVAQGLLYVASDQYEDAKKTFQLVIDHEIQRRERDKTPDALDNPIESNAVADMKNHLYYGILEAEDSLLAVAVNNFSICCLNLKQLPTAVESMEKLIQHDPVKNMVDPIVFNLCTMYDLSCAPEVATMKKKTLQQVASMYHISDLHWRSFRLN